MNLVNIASSLNSGNKAVLKIFIDRKHLSAFLQYLEEFKGGFLKVKLVSVNSPRFYEFDENEGKQVFRKITAIRHIKDRATDNSYSILQLKDFVEYNGTLDMTVGDMKKLEDLGFVLEEVG